MGKLSSSHCLLLSSCFDLRQLLKYVAIDAVQEAWYLLPHLRHLDVSSIGTPVSKRQLDSVLSRLPALEFVRLHFRTTGNLGFEYGRDPDSDDAPGARQLVKHNNFPPNLLRWVLPLCMSDASSRPAASCRKCCLLCLLVVMLLVTHGCLEHADVSACGTDTHQART